ncbi:MAG: hypothetical protein RLZZ09_1528 [Pseudomonadota bacterium]|jgi:hypothetical protein
MRAFGAPEDVIHDTLESQVEDDGQCQVWEENWDTLMVFLALQTQWRREIPAMSGQMIWHGLRYTEAEVVIRMMGHQKQQKDIFDGLRVMESTALPILNKPSK